MDDSGASWGSSITRTNSIYWPNQRFLLQAVVHEMSNLGRMLPVGFPSTTPLPIPCSPSPWPRAIAWDLLQVGTANLPPPILPRTVPWWERRLGIAADHPMMGSSCQQHVGHNLTRKRPNFGGWRQRDGTG